MMQRIKVVVASMTRSATGGGTGPINWGHWTLHDDVDHDSRFSRDAAINKLGGSCDGTLGTERLSTLFTPVPLYATCRGVCPITGRGTLRGIGYAPTSAGAVQRLSAGTALNAYASRRCGSGWLNQLGLRNFDV